MSNIPRAREWIGDIVTELVRRGQHDLAGQLTEVQGDLYRRRPARARAPTQNLPVDARMAATLREYARTHPRMPLQEIGHKFNVNAGRVSEALQGNR